jgi:hypothetical protein
MNDALTGYRTAASNRFADRGRLNLSQLSQAQSVSGDACNLISFRPFRQ